MRQWMCVLALSAFVCSSACGVVLPPEEEQETPATKKKPDNREPEPNVHEPQANSEESLPNDDLLPDDLKSAALDAFFKTQIRAAGAPGMAAAVISKSGTIAWKKAYGLADVEAGRAATPDTLFYFPTASAVVTAAALLQVMEQQGLAFDAPIEDRLLFPVVNPFPYDAAVHRVTYQEILTHTSGLRDDLSAPIVSTNEPLELAHYLAAYVDKQQNWHDDFAKKCHYSSTNVALAGVLVESITGMDLETYSKQKIFQPLGMKESSWFLKGINRDLLAMPYEDLKPQGFYTWIDYPNLLRTSATELGRYLLMVMKQGELDGQRVLSATAAARFMQPQIPTIDPAQNLLWYSEILDGVTVSGHSGGSTGASTEMWFDVQTRAGFVLLTNGGAYSNGVRAEGTNATPAVKAMSEMNKKLLKLANALP